MWGSVTESMPRPKPLAFVIKLACLVDYPKIIDQLRRQKIALITCQQEPGLREATGVGR